MGNNYTNLAVCETTDDGPDSSTKAFQYLQVGPTSRYRMINQNADNKIKHSASNASTYPTIHPTVHQDAISTLVPIRPGMILCGGRDKMISLNNIDSGECVSKWYGHSKEVTKVLTFINIHFSLTILPSEIGWKMTGGRNVGTSFNDEKGRRIVIISENRNVDRKYVISTSFCTMQSQYSLKIAYLNACGKHRILSASRDTLVKLWQFNSPTAIQTYTGHENGITGVALIAGTQFISGSRDTTIKLWDLVSGCIIYSAKYPRNTVTHISQSSVNNMIAQTAEDKQLKLWDTRNLQLIHKFMEKDQILMHCDLSTDGLYCLTSSNGLNGNGCEITLWDIRKETILREYRGHGEAVTCAKFFPQTVIWKNLIVSVSLDRSVCLWSLDDGDCLCSEQIPSDSDLLSCVGFNDGNIVVSGLNATLCHLRLLAQASRPYLKCISLQSTAHSIFNWQ